MTYFVNTMIFQYPEIINKGVDVTKISVITNTETVIDKALSDTAAREKNRFKYKITFRAQIVSSACQKLLVFKE